VRHRATTWYGIAPGGWRSPWFARGALSVLLVGVSLNGCVSDSPTRPDASSMRKSGVRPSGLVLVVPNSFIDTDSDRILDSATIVLYLMGPAGPRDELLPIEAPGQAEFRLADREGRGIAVWAFDAEQVRAQWATLGPGPALVFKLTLPREQQARRRSSGEISCTFQSPDGRVLHGSRPEPIVFGPAD
jgi:hypothetical protein